VDQRNDTSDYEDYFKRHGWYPGLDERNNKPAELCGDAAPDPVVPAVSANWFMKVLKKYKLRFKEKAVDQCTRCNVLRANIMKAAPADRPALAAE
jgi:hypothetical protein